MQFRLMTLNLEQDHKRWPVRRPLILDERPADAVRRECARRVEGVARLQKGREAESGKISAVQSASD